MISLIVFVQIVVIIVLVVMMLRQGFDGTVDLFSLRNMFLVGFIIFQLISGATSLALDDWDQLTPANPLPTGAIFTVMAIIFLVVCLHAYRRGWWVCKLAARPAAHVEASPNDLMLLAFFMVITGLLLRFVVGQIPVVGVLTGQMSSGVLAIACGLAAWAWAPRMYNPNLTLAVAGILLIALLSLFVRSFSRREVLGVLLGFSWGMYYGYWRYIGLGGIFRRTWLVGLLIFVFIAYYSAARSGKERDRTIGETVRAMRSVSFDDFKRSAMGLLIGQYAAANSMWAIEMYPKPYPYDTLHQLRYYVSNPIPRKWWENKPNSLGRDMVVKGTIKRVGKNYSVGPGVIGHTAVDNPWIALPLYAIVFGLVLRLVDERVTLNLENPFVVLPAGAALSQVMGMPRGETALFLFNATVAIVGGWVVLNIAAYLMASVGWLTRHAPEEPAWAEEEPPAPTSWHETDEYRS